MNTSLEKIYKDHQVKPYISPDRDIETWLLNPKPVPRYHSPLENQLWNIHHRNMILKTPIRI